MKIYTVSGLGADEKVLERLRFPPGFEAVFLPWLIPERKESFSDYAKRMAEKIDTSQPFVLLGYSLGGMLVQEIHCHYPAVKVIILGSIRSHQEKSIFIKLGEKTAATAILPVKLYGSRSLSIYAFFRKIFLKGHGSELQFFRMRDPQYLQWAVHQAAVWRNKKNVEVVQIMGDLDIIFPIKRCRPDYVISGGTHLFPATRAKEVSAILKQILETLIPINS